MRFARYWQNGREGLVAVDNGGVLHGLLMGPGDCEMEVEAIGVLRNPIVEEAR
jgi:hypothetical protein